MKVFAPAAFFFLPALAACSIPTPGSFYRQAALLNAPHGAPIAVEPFSPTVKGAAAYRVLYNSEDIHGGIIPVSGIIYVPLAPPPPGGRNLVAWAHPTTGIAPGCAPSLDKGVLGGLSFAESIPGLDAFISAGDVVAATDYQGMGVQGVHPYLIGKSEGQNILDSVLAAERLPGADLSGNFVVWGHSQGGQAALFAGQLAASYTPELHLAGVAAAAPPTNMKGELTEKFTGNGGRLLAAYVYHSWSITYHVPITTVVYPQAVPHVDKAAAQCINTLGEGLAAIHAASGLNPVFLKGKPSLTPPWPGLFDENSPGQAPPGGPLLIVQGAKDPTVEPHWTRSFVAAACARHDVVDFQELKGVKHLLIAYKSRPIVEHWIAARFAGEKPPDNCRATAVPTPN